MKCKHCGRVVWEGGRERDYIQVTGDEAIKGNFSKYGREVTLKTIEYILMDKEEELISLLREAKDDFTLPDRRIKLDFDDIAFTIQLHQPLSKAPNTSYYRGTRYANQYFNTDIRDEDMVKMIYVKRVPGYPPTDVICFLDQTNLPPGIVVDWDRMFNLTVKTKVESKLSLVNLSWNRILGQKSISDFFGRTE